MVKLPLLPSGPGGVRLPPVHSPWRSRHYWAEKVRRQRKIFHQSTCKEERAMIRTMRLARRVPRKSAVHSPRLDVCYSFPFHPDMARIALGITIALLLATCAFSYLTHTKIVGFENDIASLKTQLASTQQRLAKSEADLENVPIRPGGCQKTGRGPDRPIWRRPRPAWMRPRPR